jgi:hypothetical protein
VDRPRKALSRMGPLLAGVLLIAALAAGSAQAVTISPDNTAVTGTANDPTLEYGDVVWTCDTSTVVGITGVDSDVVDVDIEFQEPCDVSGLDATIDCADGNFTRLRALDGTTNLGEVDEFLPGFECAWVVEGICTMTIGAQDLTANNDADLLNEAGAHETLAVNLDLRMTNDNTYCGPVPSGTANLTGNHVLNSDIRFDP